MNKSNCWQAGECIRVDWFYAKILVIFIFSIFKAEDKVLSAINLHIKFIFNWPIFTHVKIFEFLQVGEDIVIYGLNQIGIENKNLEIVKTIELNKG